MPRETPTAASSRDRRALVGAIAIAGATLAVVAAVRCGAGSRASTSTGDPAAPVARDERALRAPLPPRPQCEAAPAPIVDRVTAEKTEVCEGEENLVTVEAHTPGGVDDAFLHAVIAGEPGMQVPVVSFRDKQSGEVRPRTILVFGRGDEPVQVPMPAFTVKECMVDRRVVIDFRLRANTDAELELVARVEELSASTPFAPVRWRWDFGDGSTLETDEGYAVHSYEERPEGETLFAHLLVRVEAIDARGERVAGRHMIVLQNRAFANLAFAGIVTLSTRLTPRFPERGPDGVVRQRVRLWHHRPDPVRIDRAIARRNRRDGRYEERAIDVAGLLGTTTIAPAGIEIAVALDTRHEPDVISIDYWLEGTSAEGLPVRGIFPVMAPPPRPTKEQHEPVRDPALVARIKRARELLGQELVTDEELWRLERQGAFEDLPALGAAGDDAPTYGDLAAHPARPGEPPPSTPLVSGGSLPVE